MSLAECTAMSIRPSSSASSSSLTKTPREPISPNGLVRSRSPAVVIGTSAISTPGRRKRSEASSACVSASREPREPTLSSIASAPGQLDELGHIALEPRQLRRDDRHPREHPDEHDQVGGRDVLLPELTAAALDPDRIDRSVQTDARAELARPEIGIASDASR
jgi:hypothetical protein